MLGLWVAESQTWHSEQLYDAECGEVRCSWRCLIFCSLSVDRILESKRFKGRSSPQGHRRLLRKFTPKSANPFPPVRRLLSMSILVFSRLGMHPGFPGRSSSE
jgi:hypothetical protein